MDIHIQGYTGQRNKTMPLSIITSTLAPRELSFQEEVLDSLKKRTDVSLYITIRWFCPDYRETSRFYIFETLDTPELLKQRPFPKLLHPRSPKHPHVKTSTPSHVSNSHT